MIGPGLQILIVIINWSALLFDLVYRCPVPSKLARSWLLAERKVTRQEPQRSCSIIPGLSIIEVFYKSLNHEMLNTNDDMVAHIVSCS